MTTNAVRALGARSKVTAQDIKDLASGVATSTGSGGTSPGTAGSAPSPHSLSSAHHTGEIGDNQASQFAFTEGEGTDRPAYNSNRMTGALAHVLPNATDTYDLGDSTKWWRKAYISEIEAAVFAENVIQLLGGWFVVGHAQGTLQMPTSYLQVETATVLGAVTTGVAQVETATITGTATDAGTMTVVVTASGMTGSPITLNIAFDDETTAAQMGAIVRAQLSFNANIVAYFTIGGSGADVALTRKAVAANDGTMNIAISGASAEGFPDHATSTNTTAGVASGVGNATVIVTAAGMTGTPKTVSVAVADADTAALVAGKIRTALAADADVGAFFTVSGSGADVALTSVAYTASNDATMNISINNGTCTGLTAALTSTSTTAGGVRADIDFGVSLSVNDFILIKSHDVTGTIKTEYMQVTASVSGTTYTVTRDLAGAHSPDPVWAEGTVWLNLGYTGDGRIEFNASDTPRMQMFTQGATYNAQTEVLRAGDLNAGWGYVAETYGMAIGEYAADKPNITIDSTNGLRIRNYTADMITLDTSGNAKIVGKLQMLGASSAIAIGATPPSSATVGTGIWLDRTGMYGLAADVQQAIFDATTGAITAGAGKIKLDSTGITLIDDAGIIYYGTTPFIHILKSYTVSPGYENLFFGMAGNRTMTSAAVRNLGLGTDALVNTTTGAYNVAIGSSPAQELTTGSNNVAVGLGALFQNQTGSNNVAIGPYALQGTLNTSYSGNVAIGNYAGAYETGSDAFYVNNQDRTDTAGDKAKSLLYGVFAATAAGQSLTVNAGATTLSGDLAVNGGDLTSTATTFNLLNATVTTLNLGGAATVVNLGAASCVVNGAGGVTINGGVAANDDLTLQGTSHATRTTSYVLLQPNGGNVGIGTTAPNANLDVRGTLYGGLATIEGFDSAAQAANVGGGLFLGGKYTDAGAYTEFGGLKAGKDNATTGQYGGYLALYSRTNGAPPAERVRIDSAGNVGIGTTSPTANSRLHVVGGSTVCDGVDTSSSYYSLICRSSTPGNLFLVRNDGICTMNAYGAGTATFSAAGVISSVSDARAKDWIGPLGPVLDKVVQLNPGYWSWKEERPEYEGGRRNIGIVAQDIQRFWPELVGESAGGMLSLHSANYGLGILTKAIQEEHAIVDSHEQEIRALKARIEALEARLAA